MYEMAARLRYQSLEVDKLVVSHIADVGGGDGLEDMFGCLWSLPELYTVHPWSVVCSNDTRPILHAICFFCTDRMPEV